MRNSLRKKLWTCRTTDCRIMVTALGVATAEQVFLEPDAGAVTTRRCGPIYTAYVTLGHAVAQLVEALRYKPEGRGFDSRWCYCNFSSIQSFRPHYGPRVNSASNRNEYQEYFLGGKGGRCVGLTTLPLSYPDCLEIWETNPSGNLKACPGL